MELLIRHRDRLTALKPDTVETRKLQFLVEHRRKLVDDKTAYSNQLTGWLKQIFPQVLRWFEDPAAPIVSEFLKRWPTLEQLRRARTTTVQEFFRKHNSRNQERIQKRLAEIKLAVPATNDEALLVLTCITQSNEPSARTASRRLWSTRTEWRSPCTPSRSGRWLRAVAGRRYN